MTDNRDPYDGQPYYCKLCGAGGSEYYGCELPDCVLESEAEAKFRAQRRRPMTSDAAHFVPAAERTGLVGKKS